MSNELREGLTQEACEIAIENPYLYPSEVVEEVKFDLSRPEKAVLIIAYQSFATKILRDVLTDV